MRFALRRSSSGTAWRMILEYLVTNFVEMILMHLDKSFWSRNHITDTVEIGEQVLDEQNLVDIIKFWFLLGCLDTFHHLVRLAHCFGIHWDTTLRSGSLTEIGT